MEKRFEQVAGPVRGYFIAAYACESGRSGDACVSYFKVCAARPESYFDDAVTLHKGSFPSVPGDPGAALQVAMRQARELVYLLPEASELPAFRQLRPLFCWEAAELGLL